MALAVQVWRIVSRTAVAAFWVLMLVALLLNACRSHGGGYDPGFVEDDGPYIIDASAHFGVLPC